MAVQEIQNTSDLKKLRENISIADADLDENLTVGSIAYSDFNQKLLLGSNKTIGVIKNKKLTAVTTDSESRIKSIQPISNKILGFQQLFVDENQDNKEYEITQMLAAGATFYQFNISFDRIYKSKLEWDSNSDIFWAKYDRIYNFVKDKFEHFGVRIACIEDDTNFYINRSGVFHSSVNDVNFRYAPTVTVDNINGTSPPPFYADSDIVMDQFGQPFRAKSGWGRPTMFKDSARLKMVEFVRRVILRYPLIFSKAIWLSTPTTSDHEMGLEYIQSWDGSGFSSGSHSEGWYAIPDYHPLSQQYFRLSFLPARYGTITNLNKYWSTNYTRFEDVEIPKIPNVSNINQTSYSNLYAITNSTAYLDWRLHNIKGLERFWLECLTLVNQLIPNVEYNYEVGSATDKDTIYRGTDNLINIKNICKSIKCQFEVYSWGGTNPSESAAIIRKNWPFNIYIEMNSNDVPTQSDIKDTVAIKNAMIQTSKQAFRNGAEIVIIICTNEINPRISTNGNFGVNQFPKSLEVVSELSEWLNTGEQYYGVNITNTIKQNLSYRARNFNAARQDWLNSGGVNCSIEIVDDLTSVGNNSTVPSEMYYLNGDSAHTEIQSYIPQNLAKVEILKETYNYTLEESYYYNHATHSICQHQTIHDNLKRALCNLTVIGRSSGKIYARTTQNSGTAVKNAIRDDININSSMAANSIKAGNNHPRIEDIDSLYRDCKINIKPNEELLFRWENIGTASVEVSLIAPDSPEAYPNLVFIEQCLAPNTTLEYIFNPNRTEFQNQPRWKRQIKSNMNAMLNCNQ